jgi:VWFA-related protein
MTMSRIGPILIAGLAMSVAAGAQAPVAAKGDARQVRLDVTVVSKDGAPVAGLMRQDFTLRDFTQKDNKAAVPITSFNAVGAGQSEVGVIVLIDAVNIPFSTVSYVRGQVLKYLRLDEGKLAQPTAIAVLTDQGLQMQHGFTRDGNGLASDLEKQEIGLREINRSGGYWGADERLQISLKAIHDLAAYGGTLPGRKAVLWISPGWPLLSGPGVDLSEKQEQGIFNDIVSFSTDLRQARVTIYNINPLGAGEGVGRAQYYRTFLKGVNKPSQVDLGDLGLQVLAVQSGGLALEGSTDVTGILKRCVRETTAWYEIGFEMGPAEKEVYHHVVVEVDKPGVVVRTRDGYYERP